MLSLSYDLHIHSCLSPCGDNESTPCNIVGMAYVKGLDVIAVTDHNSAKNCPAAVEAAKEFGITVVCGMELTTAEEVHVLCLLPSLEKALELDEYVQKRLIKIKNDPKIFGEQLIMNSADEVSGSVENLLINAADISFCETFELLEGFGGIAIPAHIDKSANSLLSNLGFIPPDSSFKTVEVHRRSLFPDLCQTHGYLSSCRVISNSDAHYLGDINEPENFLHAEENSAEAVIEALKKPSEK